MTVGQVFAKLRHNPAALLLGRWNWKSACVAATIRAIIYFFTSLKAGWRPALVAMGIEAIYRVPLAGMCGSFTQAMRNATPEWAATLSVMICLPITVQGIELAIHFAQGAPRLRLSTIVSVCFTIIAGLFNLYAMRRGVYVVGREGTSFRDDVRRTPAIVAGFIASGPMLFSRLLRSGAEPGTARTSK